MTMMEGLAMSPREQPPADEVEAQSNDEEVGDGELHGADGRSHGRRFGRREKASAGAAH
jgi:hypothetical protein